MERAAGLTERRWVIFEKPGVVHLFSNEAEHETYPNYLYPVLVVLTYNDAQFCAGRKSN